MRLFIVDSLLFGKRPQKRPQPSSLCDCVRCPVAILEVSVSNTARRAGAQSAVQAAALLAAYGWPLARCTSARPCPAPWRQP